MTVRPDPAWLFGSNVVVPELTALRLPLGLHLEAVAETLRGRGMLHFQGRDLIVLHAEVCPAELEDLLDAVVVVVVMDETDGSCVTLYLD